ncbi:MAG TPA: putative phage abortive infection protein [Gammaproteobacteria bacterium]|nr:putative phage abortive infection protein [Gammaproteobacteria bacterium]
MSRISKTGWLFPALLFGFVLGVWLLSWYFLENRPDRGTFGDMFGSVNALFSGLAFAALIYTIFLQRRELKLQHHELQLAHAEMKAQVEQLQAQNVTLKKQSFEDTFFELLRLQNDITNSIDLNAPNGHVVKGRDCFKFLHEKFSKVWKIKPFKGVAEQEKINRTYLLFYEDYESEVGPYFSNLYNVLKFVDTSDVANKKLYTNFVRAQLSSFELVMIFYSALTGLDKGGKFKVLLEKYAMLKSMSGNRLLNPEHFALYDGSAYG